MLLLGPGQAAASKKNLPLAAQDLDVDELLGSSPSQSKSPPENDASESLQDVTAFLEAEDVVEVRVELLSSCMAAA